MKKFLQYSLFIFLLSAIMAGMVSFGLESANTKNANDFNAAKFTETEFNMAEFSLFLDIAFAYEGVRIRKWSKDIKVEIKNIDEISRQSVDEIDSVIAILAPLIAPLKIERVNKGGNLHVYRRVSSIPASKPNARSKPTYLNGLAQINEKSPYSWDIHFACVYDDVNSDLQTLLHEFEHAIGLNHPVNLYSYYLTIGRSVIPQYFRTQEEFTTFIDRPFYLSEQEKTVIKMLYSPEIKSGLHIDLFARKMGLTETDIRRILPNKDKKPEIVIYPPYQQE